MKDYIYLFRGGDPEGQPSPDEMQAIMQKWGAWMQGLGDKCTGGEPLTGEGRVVRKNTEVVTNGPFAEGTEVVGGYLMIKASNFDEAVATSKGCPIFDNGGTVEVREIQAM